MTIIKIIRSAIFIIAAIFSFITAFAASDNIRGYVEEEKIYGGEAYTGIQNAAASAATNVYWLSEQIGITCTFAFITLGVVLLGCAVPNIEKKQ